MKKENVWRKEFDISGTSLVDVVKRLIHEGDIRRITIKNEHGEVLIEIPLLIGSVVAFAAPVLAAVGAIGALVAHLTVIVEKVADEDIVDKDAARKNITQEGITEKDIVDGILVGKAAGPEVVEPEIAKAEGSGSRCSEQLEIISEEEALASILHTEYPYEPAEMWTR